MQNHKLFSLVTASKATTTYRKVIPDSFILCGAFPRPIICNWAVGAHARSTQEAGGWPTAGGWRRKGSERKSYSTGVRGRGGTVCSEMPGGCIQWQPFFLVFPSGCCFPEEQLRRAPHLPQTSTLPQETPPSPCQNSNFVDVTIVAWGKSVNESSLENIPIFPPSSLVKIFQRNKIRISLAAWGLTAFTSTSPLSLCTWSSGKGEENLYENHPKLPPPQI